MVNPFRLFSDPKIKPPDIPGNFIGLTLRWGQDFLFDLWPQGYPGPFFSQLQTNQPLPPTLGSEGLLAWVREAAAQLDLPEESILAHGLCPPEPMRPFENNFVHLVILDVAGADFERIRRNHPRSVVLSANFILQHVGQNFFFRPISETYRVPAADEPFPAGTRVA